MPTAAAYRTNIIGLGEVSMVAWNALTKMRCPLCHGCRFWWPELVRQWISAGAGAGLEIREPWHAG